MSAAIYLRGDPACFEVDENPDDAERKVIAAMVGGETFVLLTASSDHTRWAGRSLRIRGDDIVAITPPLSSDDD